MKDCVSSLCTYNRVHEIHYPRTRPVRLPSRSLLTRTNHPETGGNHIVHRKSGPSHTGFPHHHGNTGQVFPGSGRAIAADAQRRDRTPPFPLNRPGKRRKKAACIVIKKDPTLAARGEEAYSIQSSPNGIILSAADARGIFYAGQSLVQMMPSVFHDRTADKSAVRWNISETPFRITDYPRFSWRALMIDEARHFFGEKNH